MKTKMNQAHWYQSGTFTPTTLDFGPCPEGHNWPEWLKSLGWESQGKLPEDADSEFGPFEISFYLHEKHDLWLTEIWDGYRARAYILCRPGLDTLLLQRDLIGPLLQTCTSEVMRERIKEAAHCLFDPEYGLRCAQEVTQRDRRHEREMIAARKAQKAGAARK